MRHKRDPEFITRRDPVMTTPATGFAVACTPIASDTRVDTGAQGITAGEITVHARDGEIPAYRAMPANCRNLPTVLVVQEIFGVHEHIKDVCRRFAALGYLAIAPELYARQGDVSGLASIDDIRPIVARVPDAQVMADLDGAAEWAAKNGGDPGKLAITGFCWGGRIVWLYAAHNPNLKAAVAWYGRVEGAGNPLQPKNPIDVASLIKAPVLGLYGGADAGIPNDGVERMRAALKAANRDCEIHTYPDVPHAFHADYRPSYRKDAAEDGWRRALAWFREHGVA